MAYRGGGVNTRSVTFAPFDEDEVESLEFGLKSEWLDRRLRVNAAAYWSEYRDAQIDISAPTAQNPTATDTINGANPADIQGLELDITAVPVAGLTVNLSYAYTDSDIPLGGHSQLKVALWGKNLTDEENQIFNNDSLTSAGLINGFLVIYDTPRTFGADITYDF